MTPFVVFIGLCGPNEVAAFYRHFILNMNAGVRVGRTNYTRVNEVTPPQPVGISRAIHRNSYRRCREQASCSWRRRHHLKRKRT